MSSDRHRSHRIVTIFTGACLRLHAGRPAVHNIDPAQPNPIQYNTIQSGGGGVSGPEDIVTTGRASGGQGRRRSMEVAEARERGGGAERAADPQLW